MLQEQTKHLNVKQLFLRSVGTNYSTIFQWYQEHFRYYQVWDVWSFHSNSYVLRTDPQKRAAYDSGTDPEDRFGGMGSRSSGFSTSFRNGAQFEGELSPEDLFNMFFGGGGVNTFNSGFGGGPGSSPRLH